VTIRNLFRLVTLLDVLYFNILLELLIYFNVTLQ